VLCHIPSEPLLHKDILARPVFGESIFVGDMRFLRAAKVIEDRSETSLQTRARNYIIFSGGGFFLRLRLFLASSVQRNFREQT
jgi:hypothetical protein